MFVRVIITEMEKHLLPFMTKQLVLLFRPHKSDIYVTDLKGKKTA